MARLRLSALAQADIVQALSWSAQRHGDLAEARYERLISAALRDLIADPFGRGVLPDQSSGSRYEPIICATAGSRPALSDPDI